MNRFIMGLAAAVFCEVAAAGIVPPPPVQAPAGYQWVLNEAYSDEFDGVTLDKQKWHDSYPGWVGRVPGKFVSSSVTVNDGFLQIKCTVLDPPQGVSNQWTVACGAVQSRARDARYGYYETRMKASGISTSSTFWLKNFNKEKSTELDIQECVGGAKRWASFKMRMGANTHVSKPTVLENGEPVVMKKGDFVTLPASVNERFYTYGCWWIDANTMKFYLDGEYVFTIEPSTELDATPFDQPMFVNLVCETYGWEVPPTVEELTDDSRNTAYYDYVRAYKLTKITE